MKTAVGGKLWPLMMTQACVVKVRALRLKALGPLLGLCAFPQVNRKSVERAVGYLISTQNPDGSWSETLITGNRFPTRILSQVRHVPEQLAAHGACSVSLAEFLRIGPNPA